VEAMKPIPGLKPPAPEAVCRLCPWGHLCDGRRGTVSPGALSADVRRARGRVGRRRHHHRRDRGRRTLLARGCVLWGNTQTKRPKPKKKKAECVWRGSTLPSRTFRRSTRRSDCVEHKRDGDRCALVGRDRRDSRHRARLIGRWVVPRSLLQTAIGLANPRGHQFVEAAAGQHSHPRTRQDHRRRCGCAGESNDVRDGGACESTPRLFDPILIKGQPSPYSPARQGAPFARARANRPPCSG